MTKRDDKIWVNVYFRESIDGMSAFYKAKRIAELANYLKNKENLRFELTELNREVKFSWEEEMVLNDEST